MELLPWTILAVLLISGALAAPQKTLEKQELGAKLNGGGYEWKFVNQNDQFAVNLSIGTPPQEIQVFLDFLQTDRVLTVSSKNFGGVFDEDFSSTWTFDQIVDDNGNHHIGKSGTDDIFVGEMELDKSYFIVSNSLYPAKAYFGLGYNTGNDYNFLQKMVRSLGKQVISIAFDDYPNSGALTLGGIDTKRCYSNWKIMPKTTEKVNDVGFWGVEISKLTVGKFSASSSGKMMFTLGDDQTRWPKDTYAQITKELGSIDGETIPCDANKTIDFQVEDILISLTPDVYLDREMEQDLGVCTLVGSTVEVSKEYTLPRAIFNNFCLSIDYERSEVGLATRRKQKQ